jgi:hypothetical protein
MPLLESDVKKLLKCELCNQSYDLNEQPRILPCFKTSKFENSATQELN